MKAFSIWQRSASRLPVQNCKYDEREVEHASPEHAPIWTRDSNPSQKEITMNKLVLLTGAVAFSAVSFGTTTVASVQNTPVYYLSLGDSLSVGVQPDRFHSPRGFA